MKSALTLLPFLVIAIAPQTRAALYAIDVEADAFVRAALPDGNYGRGGLISVSGATATNSSGTPNGAFDAFLRFATSATRTQLDTDFGAGQWRITAAALQLTAVTFLGNAIFNTGAGQFETRWINGDNWEEGIGNPNSPGLTGITWNTRADFLNAVADRSLGTFANPQTAEPVSFNLALHPDFVADLMSDSHTSFQLTAATSAIGFGFRSREFGSATPVMPQLLITAEPIPEPATAVLMGVALAMTRRRLTPCLPVARGGAA